MIGFLMTLAFNAADVMDQSDCSAGLAHENCSLLSIPCQSSIAPSTAGSQAPVSQPAKKARTIPARPTSKFPPERRAISNVVPVPHPLPLLAQRTQSGPVHMYSPLRLNLLRDLARTILLLADTRARNLSILASPAKNCAAHQWSKTGSVTCKIAGAIRGQCHVGDNPSLP